MRLFAAWMGIGAALQVVLWFWNRRRVGRYAAEVGYRATLPHHPMLLVMALVVNCLTWPFGLAMLLIPSSWSGKLFPKLVGKLRGELEGRCQYCGELLDH